MARGPSGKAIRDQIEAVLNDAAAIVDGEARTTLNRDGTVDGQITIPLSRGEQVTDKLFPLEPSFQKGLPKGVYISTGFRWEPKPGQEHLKYDRERGLFQIFSRFYKSIQDANVVTETIAEKMERKRFRKPVQLIVRIHWNRWGERPPREE